jgi:hypothetical protein
MSQTDATTAPTHPEEMTTEAEFHIGNLDTVRLRARCTPAGLVCAAILVSSVLVSVGWMMRQHWTVREQRLLMVLERPPKGEAADYAAATILACCGGADATRRDCERQLQPTRLGELS